MKKFFNVTNDKDYQEISSMKEQFYNDNETQDVGQIALDILETKNELILLSPIAGVYLENIDITFDEQVLTISGFRKRPDIFSRDIVLKNSECFWGKFSRNIILPENLDFDRISATQDNNVLIITIPKITFTSKYIKVQKV